MRHLSDGYHTQQRINDVAQQNHEYRGTVIDLRGASIILSRERDFSRALTAKLYYATYSRLSMNYWMRARATVCNISFLTRLQ